MWPRYGHLVSVVVAVVITALVVWLLVYGARHTDAPWWKVWLLGRGIVPTSREINAAEETSGHDEAAPPHAGGNVRRGGGS